MSPDRIAAEALDARLRAQARSLKDSLEQFKDLLGQAKAEGVAEALGFNDWRSYVGNLIHEMGPLPPDLRRAIVQELTDEGMSQRDIGRDLGVSNATVSRDQHLLQDVTPPPPVVRGRDGKAYPRWERKVDKTPEQRRAELQEIQIESFLGQLESLTRKARDLFDDLRDIDPDRAEALYDAMGPGVDAFIELLGWLDLRVNEDIE